MHDGDTGIMIPRCAKVRKEVLIDRSHISCGMPKLNNKTGLGKEGWGEGLRASTCAQSPQKMTDHVPYGSGMPRGSKR